MQRKRIRADNAKPRTRAIRARQHQLAAERRGGRATTVPEVRRRRRGGVARTWTVRVFREAVHIVVRAVLSPYLDS